MNKSLITFWLRFFEISLIIFKLKRNTDIFLCLNNYSFQIATRYLKDQKRKGIIFYDNQRTTLEKFNCSIFLFSYRSKLCRILFLLIGISIKAQNLYLPHHKGGMIQKIISKLNRNHSYIDDGLDTYRKTPRNIDLSRIYPNSLYMLPYCFKDYQADWVLRMNTVLINIEPNVVLPSNLISEKTTDSNDSINLLNKKEYSVIIESPGIEFCEGYLNCDYLIQHPAKAKQNPVLASKINILKREQCLSLITSESKKITFFVGETMILLYFIKTIELYKDRTVYIGISKVSFLNLRNLLTPLLDHSRVKISFDK